MAISAPTEISGCVGWFDGADEDTITDSSGDATNWENKGSGGDVFQSSSGAYPQTGTDTINGLNVLSFNGSSQYFTRADALGFTGSPAITVFIVGKPDGSGGNQREIQIGSGANGAGISFSQTDNGMRYNNGNALFDTSTNDGSTAYVTCWTRQSGSQYHTTSDITCREGGGETPLTQTSGGGTATSVPNLSDDKFEIGAGVFNVGEARDYYAGLIAEVIIFNRVLSDAELNQVGNYIAAKWGVTWVSWGAIEAAVDFAVTSALAAARTKIVGASAAIGLSKQMSPGRVKSTEAALLAAVTNTEALLATAILEPTIGVAAALNAAVGAVSDVAASLNLGTVAGIDLDVGFIRDANIDFSVDTLAGFASQISAQVSAVLGVTSDLSLNRAVIVDRTISLATQMTALKTRSADYAGVAEMNVAAGITANKSAVYEATLSVASAIQLAALRGLSLQAQCSVSTNLAAAAQPAKVVTATADVASSAGLVSSTIASLETAIAEAIECQDVSVVTVDYLSQVALDLVPEASVSAVGNYIAATAFSIETIMGAVRTALIRAGIDVAHIDRVSSLTAEVALNFRTPDGRSVTVEVRGKTVTVEPRGKTVSIRN